MKSKEGMIKKINRVIFELTMLITELQTSVDTSHTTEVIDLDFSVRTLNCLRSNDIVFVSDIYNLGLRELRSTRGFGKKSIQDLKEVLRFNGFELLKLK